MSNVQNYISGPSMHSQRGSLGFWASSVEGGTCGKITRGVGVPIFLFYALMAVLDIQSTNIYASTLAQIIVNTNK